MFFIVADFLNHCSLYIYFMFYCGFKILYEISVYLRFVEMKTVIEICVQFRVFLLFNMASSLHVKCIYPGSYRCFFFF